MRLQAQGFTISTSAGNGALGYTGDGGPANAAEFHPWCLTLDALGNLYISDWFNNVVRKVTANGAISTVAGNGTLGYSGDGGPATSAQLAYPCGVAVDPAGDLYIADSANNVIREVTAAGNSRPSPATTRVGTPATLVRPLRPNSTSRPAWPSMPPGICTSPTPAIR